MAPLTSSASAQHYKEKSENFSSELSPLTSLKNTSTALLSALKYVYNNVLLHVMKLCMVIPLYINAFTQDESLWIVAYNN